jgi:hypothetical protein
VRIWLRSWPDHALMLLSRNGQGTGCKIMSQWVKRMRASTLVAHAATGLRLLLILLDRV